MEGKQGKIKENGNSDNFFYIVSPITEEKQKRMEIQINFSMQCHQLLIKKFQALNNAGHLSEGSTSKDKPQKKKKERERAVHLPASRDGKLSVFLRL